MKHAIACAFALTLLAAAPAAAQNPDPIEAVWSFSGGQVAVELQPDGSFIGTIIRPTQLSECTHQNGEQMWINIRRQPDGQYFGGHQYFRTSDCSFIAERGMIALRVLQNAQGQTFLRVCFDDPDVAPDEQPTIAPDGSNATTQDGCRDSDLVSPLPREEPRLSDIVTLPRQTGRCASRRRFAIRLREPVGDALESARITLNGRRLRVTRNAANRLGTVVDLRGLPRGRYRVAIVAETVRGRTIRGSRRYRTCGKRRRIGNVGPI